MTAGEGGGHRLKGCLIGLLSASFYSVVPVASKYSQRGMNTATFVFLWSLLGVAYTSLYFTSTGTWGEVRRQVKSHWRTFVVIGCCHAASTPVYFYAITLIDPTVASFFGRSSVIFSLLLGVVFLRERFTIREALGIALAIAGALIISYKSGRIVVLGMALVFASSFIFAFYTMLAKMRIGRVHPMVLVGAPAVVSASLLLLGGVSLGKLNFAAPGGSYAALGAAVFFSSFLSMTTFYRSMRYVGFAIASALRSAQIVFVALLSALTLKMWPSLQQWVGGLAIVAGVTLITLGGAKGKPAPAATADDRDDRT